MKRKSIYFKLTVKLSFSFLLTRVHIYCKTFSYFQRGLLLFRSCSDITDIKTRLRYMFLYKKYWISFYLLQVWNWCIDDVDMKAATPRSIRHASNATWNTQLLSICIWILEVYLVKWWKWKARSGYTQHFVFNRKYKHQSNRNML